MENNRKKKKLEKNQLYHKSQADKMIKMDGDNFFFYSFTWKLRWNTHNLNCLYVT